MRNLKPPFAFDLKTLLTNARRQFGQRVGNVTIKLPFVSFSVSPHDAERKVAKEIVIRMADRRVLNAFECCDNCIDQALASLQEIRSLLVDKQVQLADATDGPVYLLCELMLEAIRQFLTFEQQLREGDRQRHHRTNDAQQRYFAALEMLRAHLHRCLAQVSAIADLPIPKIAEQMRYDDCWQLEAYEQPGLPAADSDGNPTS